jgi:pSer/pThr/pTyr-binding forkhead associated (FHA) protein
MAEPEKCTQSIQIHVTAGPARGRSFVFDKPGHLIFGRASDAHISIPGDPYVSRRHFELIITPPTCLLRDLHSTNGVFVNGVHYGGQAAYQTDPAQTHIGEVLLDDGDEIVVRETRISITIRSAEKPEQSTQILMAPRGSLPDRDLALLLMIIPELSPAQNPQGETLFSAQVGALLTQVKRHSSSEALLFLKYLDKGLIMAFASMEPAYALARDLFDLLSPSPQPIRMALHWGTVRTRRNGDVFGREVHRIYRIADIQMPAEGLDAANGPQRDYLLITPQGLTQLPQDTQRQFRALGAFPLEGFDDPCTLWALTRHLRA